MRYELFIGLRYLRSKKRHQFISIIGLISILGVFIGVMALNVVLSVMRGFEDELKDKILGINSHIVVMSYEGPVADYAAQEAQVNAFPGVVATSPFIYGQGMIVGDRGVTGAIVRGIDPARAGRVTRIERAVAKGTAGIQKDSDEEAIERLGKEILMRLVMETESGKPPVILGRELSETVGSAVGGHINIVSPFGKLGPFGQQARVRRFEVVGIVEYGMYEYDSSLAYVSLASAASFYDMGESVSGLEIKVSDIYDAAAIGEGVMNALGYPFFTRSWQTVNKSLFRALRLERIAIGIFIGLIILVAALDIVSTLTMVVMEKGRDISILRAMGATRGGIMGIFIIDGMIIGSVGTLLGSLAGFALLYSVKTYDVVKALIPFDPQVYPISEFPVKLEPVYFLVVGIASLAICFFATLYPSYQAARKDPVEALRYE